MILNRRGEYSILGMLYLAGRNNDGFVEISEIARMVGAPEKFLRILFHELVKSRLLRSRRGTGGGFSLARAPSEITLRQIVEAIQGPITAADCAAGQLPDCEKITSCPLHVVLRGLRDRVVDELDSFTLSDLAEINTGARAARQPIQIEKP